MQNDHEAVSDDESEEVDDSEGSESTDDSETANIDTDAERKRKAEEKAMNISADLNLLLDISKYMDRVKSRLGGNLLSTVAQYSTNRGETLPVKSIPETPDSLGINKLEEIKAPLMVPADRASKQLLISPDTYATLSDAARQQLLQNAVSSLEKDLSLLSGHDDDEDMHAEV